MKGMALAIETVVYLILAVTVLSVAMYFFLSQAGPAQDQYTLESRRDSGCGVYVMQDFRCAGKEGQPVASDPELLKKIGTACGELTRRFGFSYPCTSGQEATLTCIQQCCFTCPQDKNKQP
jgi:hypothetical protein